MSETQRKKWIDLVKCIAIFVVMLNHSLLDLPGVKFWGGMFFVPVFFVLSGFTYRSREESFWSFLGRKAKRLLLPYIGAGGVLFAFFAWKHVCLSGGEFADMYYDFGGLFYARNQIFSWETPTLFLAEARDNIYLLGCLNSPTWFLPALFLTIVAFEVLYRWSKQDGKKMLLAAMILLCIANLYHYLFPVLLPWSLDAVPYFLVFFLWGYFMARKDWIAWFDKRLWVLLLLGAVFVLFALWNGSANYSVGNYGKSATMALYNGVVSSTLLMYICSKVNRWIPKCFTWPGRQSMWILCFHLFVFEIVKTVIPGVHPALMILLTAAVLTAVGAGKERWLHGKR